jgi:hypothetical protein
VIALFFLFMFAMIAAWVAYMVIAVCICLVTLAFNRAHISPFIGWGVLFVLIMIATLFRHI